MVTIKCSERENWENIPNYDDSDKKDRRVLRESLKNGKKENEENNSVSPFLRLISNFSGISCYSGRMWEKNGLEFELHMLLDKLP